MREAAPAVARLTEPLCELRAAAGADGPHDAREGEALSEPILEIAALPVPLPDAAVRRQQVQVVCQRLEHREHAPLDARPVRAQALDVTAGPDPLVDRPQEQAEVVPLDVRPVLVAVALLTTVAEVARHADQVGPPNVGLVVADIGAELERDGLPRLVERANAGERRRGKRHVAHPRDVPYARR